MPKGTLLLRDIDDRILELVGTCSQREIGRRLNIASSSVGYHLKPEIRERSRKWQKEWRRSPAGRRYKEEQRLRRVCTIDPDGKQQNIYITKRPYLGICEICGALDQNLGGKRKGSKLDWHHWDDKHPEFGLWLCFYCHRLAEAVEKRGITVDHLSLYLALKQNIMK